MSARSIIHPVQFRSGGVVRTKYSQRFQGPHTPSAGPEVRPVRFRQDKTDREYGDKADALDASGQDTDVNYGYSSDDPGDYQYWREMTSKKVVDTQAKKERF